MATSIPLHFIHKDRFDLLLISQAIKNFAGFMDEAGNNHEPLILCGQPRTSNAHSSND